MTWLCVHCDIENIVDGVSSLVMSKSVVHVVKVGIMFVWIGSFDDTGATAESLWHELRCHVGCGSRVWVVWVCTQLWDSFGVALLSESIQVSK
jgi:hypothetical protein